MNYDDNYDEVIHRGYSPLLFAVSKRNLEITKYLLINKADINVQSIENKNTPLILSVLLKNVDLINILIGYKPNLDVEGCTALLRSVFNDLFYGMSLLLNNGANPNIKNRKEQYPLFYAVLLPVSFALDAVSLFVKNKADLNVRDKDGTTAIFSCIRYSSITVKLDILNTLINNGADINAEENDGTTPLL